MKKITTQQAAPASVITQVVSALPEASNSFHKATAAPPQTGSNKSAMLNLNHFNTRQENAKAAPKPAEIRPQPLSPLHE